jgi:predicted DCC family thiol-disulfide oxidoreductase YuxK
VAGPESRDPAPVAWVLYDGACGFCSQWVPFWKGTLERRGIGIATLQEPWVAAHLLARGVAMENLLDDLRILVAGSGDVIPGADAYRFAFRRIWWARPLWVLSVTPGLRRLFDLGYRAFAENRYRVSKACRIPVKPEDPGAGP